MLKNTVSYITIFAAMAFEPGKNGWKIDANGNLELKDGNPIYVDASGREISVDNTTISRLNAEAKQHRERAEAAEVALKAFEGIDPAIAKKAVETLKNIDAKKLIDAGEVDKVKQEISQQFTAQLSEKDKALGDIKNELDNLRITSVFSQSQFIRDRIAVPADMFEASFRNYVKVKDGQIEFYDRSGNRLMSKSKLGDYASGDEAFELLVESHPQKDVILKANANGGMGGTGGGGARPGQRRISRSDFEKLSPSEQANTALASKKGEITIVD